MIYTLTVLDNADPSMGQAALFHVVLLMSTVIGVGTLLTTVDPIKVTEYSVNS